MRRILILAFVGLAILLQEEVHIRPRFTVDDEFTLTFTRSVDERMSGPRGYSASFDVQVHVVSTGADGTVLDWQPGEVQLKGAPEDADARMALAVMARANHRFLLWLDGNGQYRRLTNLSDVSASLERSRDERLARVAESGQGELIAGLKTLTAAQIASTIGQDAEIFTGLYGLAGPVGEIIEIDATFPFPRQPLEGVRRLRIVSVTEDTAEATMTAAFAERGESAAATNVSAFDLKEEARYVFDRRVGLHRQGSFDRTAARGEDRRIEHWEFSLKVPPKRRPL